MNVKVIVITGPESTGKSTLCRELAAHFGSEYINEYARDYVAERGYKYTYEDVEHIAQYQHEYLRKKIEEIRRKPAESDEPYMLFVDTHLIITKVWFEKVYGREPEWIAEAIAQSPVDLYLLCQPDTEWEYDPVRENPNIRPELYNRYKELIEQYGFKYEEVSGLGTARLECALGKLRVFRFAQDFCCTRQFKQV